MLSAGTGVNTSPVWTPNGRVSCLSVNGRKCSGPESMVRADAQY